MPRMPRQTRSLARRGAAYLWDRLLTAITRRLFRICQAFGIHIIRRHYYSPIPDTRRLTDELFSRQSSFMGISIDDAQHLEMLDRFHAEYKIEYAGLPRERQEAGAGKFYLNNGSFESVDAEVLYCVIRSRLPQQYLEIGSGYSTLLARQALRKNATQGHSTPQMTLIEPYPRRIVQDLTDVDPTDIEDLPVELIQKRVQDVPLDVFRSLRPNDILFIDSSHVAAIGSDVCYEYLEILPAIEPGVLIHIHDFFLPGEYPRKLVLDHHYFWNEQYLVQAFLSFNTSFEVVWAGSYMHMTHPEALRKAIPSYDPDRVRPGSLWIRRLNAK